MKSAFALLATLLAAGCETAPKLDYHPAVADFFLESGDSRSVSITLPQSGVTLAIGPKPALRSGDIVNVELMQVELGKCLMFQLTPAAARDLYRFSVANQGKRLVLFINGAALGARRIEAPLADGNVLVFLEVPDDTLPVLVASLKKTSADLQRAIAKKR